MKKAFARPVARGCKVEVKVLTRRMERPTSTSMVPKQSPARVFSDCFVTMLVEVGLSIVIFTAVGADGP